jgi:hypothetical protein
VIYLALVVGWVTFFASLVGLDALGVIHLGLASFTISF